MILDAGFLIAIDRGESPARTMLTALARDKAPLHTTHPVVAQVWRNGVAQARLAMFLKSVTVHPLDDGRSLGRLLALAGTRDVVDAHLVMVAARLGDSILTGDPDELSRIVEFLGAAGPTIHPWPSLRDPRSVPPIAGSRIRGPRVRTGDPEHWPSAGRR